MDKTKIFEAAGKYAAKGQNDKAAKEYQRILEEDPKDVRALQKLAEIHQKSGKMKDATDLLMRVAEGYTEQGFFLKAVAVYKQLLKSGVERIEVNQKLAQLYQQLGLIGDATQQYQQVATYFDQQGNIKESLAALRRMVELDPDNVASQVKLGELYAREQLIPEAVAELRKAGAYLKRNNRNEDYFRVLERIGQLAPDDTDAARELAQNYIAVADTKRALAKLQVCFRNNPKDVETLRLLARAFVDLGQEAKAVSVYRELAKVHQERKEATEYRQVLERIIEHAPDDPQAVAALKELATKDAPSVITTAAPSQTTGTTKTSPTTPGSRPPRKVRPLGPDVSPAVAKILTETDVYLKYGLIAKAAEHIKKALIEDLDSLDAQEKLLVIQDRQNKPEESLRTLERIIELSRVRNDQDRVTEYMGELAVRAPDHPLIAEAAPPAPIEDVDEDDEIVQPDEEFEEGILINTDPTIPPHMRPAMPMEVSIAPWERVSVEEQAVVVDAVEVPSRPPLDLGDDASFEAALDRVTGPHARRAPIDPFAVVSEPDDAVVVGDDRIPDFAGSPAWSSDVRTPFATEGVSPDAYLPTLDAHVIDQPSSPGSNPPPPLPGFEELSNVPYGDESIPPMAAPDVWGLADVDGVGTEQAVEQESYDAYVNGAVGEEVASEQAPPNGEPVPDGAYTDEYAEEYDEAEFLVQQGLLEDAQGVLEAILLAAPEHPRALALLQSLTPAEGEQLLEAPPEVLQEQQSEGYVDLAGALAEEMGESSHLAVANEGTHSVEDALAEFKKKLSVQVSAEDSQTHFDLGIAYKEMGLYDDAIHEFEIALEGRGRRRVIDCLTMLGVLRLEKGDPRGALVHFEQVLKTPGLTLEASKEAHFELGLCHEMLGEDSEAVDHYSRVFKADQGYRDVRVKMSLLREKAAKTAPPVNGTRNGVHAKGTNGAIAPQSVEAGAAAPDENNRPRGGRGKIGYI